MKILYQLANNTNLQQNLQQNVPLLPSHEKMSCEAFRYRSIHVLFYSAYCVLIDCLQIVLYDFLFEKGRPRTSQRLKMDAKTEAIIKAILTIRCREGTTVIDIESK